MLKILSISYVINSTMITIKKIITEGTSVGIYFSNLFITRDLLWKKILILIMLDYKADQYI